MMENKFQQWYEIGIFDIDEYKNATVKALMQYMQECSTLHTKYVGCDFLYMKENEFGWILLQTYTNIYRMPKLSEKIKVVTWINSDVKLFANRFYVIYDENKNIIAESFSKWIVYSFEKSRPIKISEEIKKMYKYCDEQVITKKELEEMDKYIKGNIILQPISEKFEKVLYREVDTNWHVNNINYMQYVLSTINKEFLEKNFVNQYYINYMHELVYDEAFSIKVNMINENEYIYNIVRDNKVCACVYIKWRQKSESSN